MKSTLISLGLLLAAVPILLCCSAAGLAVIGVIAVVGILAACMIIMAREQASAPPVCETCGKPIEEGADIEDWRDFAEDTKDA